MWMVVFVMLAGATSQPAFDPCGVVHKRYRKFVTNIAVAPSFGRCIHYTNYLKKMEKAVKNCFTTPKGKRLIKMRKGLKCTPPPRVTSRDSQRVEQAEDQELDDFVAGRSDKPSDISTHTEPRARKRRPSPGLAALSAILPGLGQMAQGRVGLGVIFFAGAAATHGISIGVYVSVISSKPTKVPDTLPWLFVGVGIAIAIQTASIIEAAVWRPK